MAFLILSWFTIGYQSNFAGSQCIRRRCCAIDQWIQSTSHISPNILLPVLDESFLDIPRYGRSILIQISLLSPHKILQTTLESITSVVSETNWSHSYSLSNLWRVRIFSPISFVSRQWKKDEVFTSLTTQNTRDNTKFTRGSPFDRNAIAQLSSELTFEDACKILLSRVELADSNHEEWEKTFADLDKKRDSLKTIKTALQKQTLQITLWGSTIKPTSNILHSMTTSNIHKMVSFLSRFRGRLPQISSILQIVLWYENSISNEKSRLGFGKKANNTTPYRGEIVLGKTLSGFRYNTIPGKTPVIQVLCKEQPHLSMFGWKFIHITSK